MRIFRFALILGFAALAANLIWLATSTVRIHNATNETVTSVAYSACESDHPIGDLGPGRSVFRFLEACGDDTLEILIGEAGFCQTYVEGELYHVDATINGPGDVDCKYDDLLSSLFVMKVLR